MRQVSRILLMIVFGSTSSFAQIPNLSDLNINSGGTEFFVGRMEGRPLIKVHLLSGVRAPGVYHIPVETDLIQLISYAGGYADRASLDEVEVRTHVPGKPALVSNYDLDSLSAYETYPKLTNGDIVQIPVEPDHLSRAAMWIGIAATIIGTSLAIMTYNRTR